MRRFTLITIVVLLALLALIAVYQVYLRTGGAERGPGPLQTPTGPTS
jgi:hypothetical protein